MPDKHFVKSARVSVEEVLPVGMQAVRHRLVCTEGLRFVHQFCTDEAASLRPMSDEANKC